ncbi:MAG: glycosyltransferase family 4 protein [Acidobacteriota bacterium]
MRILLAHDRIAPGDGSSRWLADVASLLVDEGHEVTVACTAFTRSVPDGVQVQSLDRLRVPADVLIAADPELLLALADQASRVVFAPLGMLAELEAEEASRERVRAAEREALERCDVVLRFTTAAVEALEHHHDLALRGKSVVAPFVSREFEAIASGAESLPLVRPRPAELLWVGRLLPTKDVAFLVRAVAKLSGDDWRLVVVGEGPCHGELVEQVETLGLSERVDIRGSVDDLAEVYSRASLFLTASRLEQFSLTLLEAQSFAVPCLGLRPDWETSFNSCEEQVLPGKTGGLFETEDELASLIASYLDDEELRQEHGLAAWRRKRREFPLERFLEGLREAVGTPSLDG